MNKICIRNKENLNNINILATCRICYQSDGVLIEPCSCKGTIAFIHNHCLEKWIQVKNDSLCCELCTSHYNINLKLYIKMKLRKWLYDEIFLLDLFFILFIFMFFIFCITIFYISMLCLERNEVWTFTTILTTTENLSVTSMLSIDKFMIFLGHLFALSIIISSMLFWLSILALWAIPYCICNTLMDNM